MCQLMIMLLEVIIKSCQNLKQCQLRSKKVLHNWPQAIVHVPPSLHGLDRVRPRILRPRFKEDLLHLLPEKVIR